LGGCKGVLACYLFLYLALCHPARPLDAELRESVAAPILLRAVDRTAMLFPREFLARSDECVRDAAIAREARARGEPTPCAVSAPAPPRDPPSARISGAGDDRGGAPAPPR
jgi:hypothetical protein